MWCFSNSDSKHVQSESIENYDNYEYFQKYVEYLRRFHSQILTILPPILAILPPILTIALGLGISPGRVPNFSGWARNEKPFMNRGFLRIFPGILRISPGCKSRAYVGQNSDQNFGLIFLTFWSLGSNLRSALHRRANRRGVLFNFFKVAGSTRKKFYSKHVSTPSTQTFGQNLVLPLECLQRKPKKTIF